MIHFIGNVLGDVCRVGPGVVYSGYDRPEFCQSSRHGIQKADPLREARTAQAELRWLPVWSLGRDQKTVLMQAVAG